jgi:hypothetical protein
MTERCDDTDELLLSDVFDTGKSYTILNFSDYICSFNGTAELRLSSVNNTVESWLSSSIIPLSYNPMVFSTV